jgi:RNA polymerase sigma-70 factor (ECF subfamily)
MVVTPMSIRKERAQFEEAVLPHLDALYGSAYRLTRNGGDAEDLVQDALLRAYRFWDSFQEGSNCKAWLFKILTNTFINSYKRKKRSKEILNAAVAEQESTDGVLIHAQALSQRTPAELIVEQSLSEDVERALAAIPADFRVAVVLCDIEGFSYKEIAEIIECPVGTVMSRLHRGRRLLHKELQDYARSQGILRDEPDRTVPGAQRKALREKAEDNTIDLDHYRHAQRLGKTEK